jgi:hypothetical protein
MLRSRTRTAPSAALSPVTSSTLRVRRAGRVPHHPEADSPQAAGRAGLLASLLKRNGGSGKGRAGA